MRKAPHFDDVVLGARQMQALQHFLKTRLRILAELLGRESRQDRIVETQDHFLSRLETGFGEDRAENRLHGVGDDRRALGAAVSHFAFAHAQEVRNAHAAADRVEHLLAHEVRAHARKIAFGEVTVAQKERVADHAVQNRVPEEFEAFVVVGRKRSVRARPVEKFLVLERIADAFFELVE